MEIHTKFDTVYNAPKQREITITASHSDTAKCRVYTVSLFINHHIKTTDIPHSEPHSTTQNTVNLTTFRPHIPIQNRAHRSDRTYLFSTSAFRFRCAACCSLTAWYLLYDRLSWGTTSLAAAASTRSKWLGLPSDGSGGMDCSESSVPLYPSCPWWWRTWCR